MTEEEARANLRKKNPTARKARVDALEARLLKLEAFIKVLIGSDEEKTVKAVSEFMGFKTVEPVEAENKQQYPPSANVVEAATGKVLPGIKEAIFKTKEETLEESPVEEKTKIKPVLGENFKANESLDEEESTITEKAESEVDECQDEIKEA